MRDEERFFPKARPKSAAAPIKTPPNVKDRTWATTKCSRRFLIGLVPRGVKFRRQNFQIGPSPENMIQRPRD